MTGSWRVGTRWWRRRPALLLTAVLTLALGVGAVTTVFTLLTAVLSPLDYPRADELVRIYQTLEGLKTSPSPRLRLLWNQVPVSFLDAEDWRRHAVSLAGVGLYQPFVAVLDVGDEPQEVTAARVESHLLSVLAVRPLHGRWFEAEESRNRAPIVLLGHELWQGSFAADPRVIGSSLTLDGKPHEVVGVMPPGFNLAGRKDRLWTPLGPTPDDLSHRDEHSYHAIGRRATGRLHHEVEDDLRRVAADLASAYPETNAGASIRLVPLLETVVGESRPVLRLVAMAGVLVWVLAVLNLVHMFLAQGVRRRAELALRLALGSSQGSLFRLLLLEALPVGVLAAGVGWLFVLLAHQALPSLLVKELPRLDRLRLDGSSVAYALLAGVIATTLAGLAPALSNTGRVLRQRLAEGTRVGWLQGGLVVAEVAVALVLAALASTLVGAWLRLSKVDPGFSAAGVLVQELRLPPWLFGDQARRGEWGKRAVDSLSALPGVLGVAITSRLPQAGPAEVWGFRIAGEGAPGGDWTQGKSAVMQMSTAGYLKLLGIALVEGEIFSETPSPESFRQVMVNHTLAKHHWPGRSAVGAELTMGETSYRVVGVFADIRHQGLEEEAGELMLQPWSQRPGSSLFILVRTIGDPLEAASEVRQALRRLESALPLSAAVRLEDVVERSLVGPRARALLIGLSAGVAWVLAAVGIYGVMSHWVSRQHREIGIRMALGADRPAVLKAILGRALMLGGVGAAVGTLSVPILGKILSTQLFGLESVDVVELSFAAAFALVSCVAAAFVPAVQASRVDAAEVLRRS